MFRLLLFSLLLFIFQKSYSQDSNDLKFMIDDAIVRKAEILYKSYGEDSGSNYYLQDLYLTDKNKNAFVMEDKRSKINFKTMFI